MRCCSTPVMHASKTSKAASWRGRIRSTAQCRSIDRTPTSSTKGTYYGYRYTNSLIPVRDQADTGSGFLFRCVVPVGLAYGAVDPGSRQGSPDPGKLEVSEPGED